MLESATWAPYCQMLLASGEWRGARGEGRGARGEGRGARGEGRGARGEGAVTATSGT